MVELTGIEPVASSLRTRRAAIPDHFGFNLLRACRSISVPINSTAARQVCLANDADVAESKEPMTAAAPQLLTVPTQPEIDKAEEYQSLEKQFEKAEGDLKD
jgi:hypothetical protein